MDLPGFRSNKASGLNNDELMLGHSGQNLSPHRGIARIKITLVTPLETDHRKKHAVDHGNL